ncbi:MAG: radical SAM protein [Catonella sp.]|nr:radical SAM protein [Catonella sp.]MDY6355644.1 radical SAM protein [Catonella sp.]
MYFIPGYVRYWEEDDNIFVQSALTGNVVRLFDPLIKKEFAEHISNKKEINALDSPLTQFLHRESLITNSEEAMTVLALFKENMTNYGIYTIMPTEACNFRCSYCYENHPNREMSYDTLNTIKKYIVNEAPRLKAASVNWFGGEPTLCRDEVLECSEDMYSYYNGIGKKISITMTTNGYLLSEEDFCRYYKAGIKSFQITMDGYEHDSMRKLANGDGTLSRITDNLDLIKSLSPDMYQFEIIIRRNIGLNDSDLEWYDYMNSKYGNDPRFKFVIHKIFDCKHISNNELAQRENLNYDSHKRYIEKLGLNMYNKDVPFGDICYASYPNSCVFRADGYIEKCTVCLGDERNIIGRVHDGRVNIDDKELNDKWCTNNLPEKCLTCKKVLSCLNLRCRRYTLIDKPGTLSCA